MRGYIVRRLNLAALIVGMVSAPAASGQVPSTPRELGMGGAYIGVARGHEAIFMAPGNLGLADAPRWSFGFPQVAIGGAVVGPDAMDLLDLAAYPELSDARKDELMRTLPEAGTAGNFAMKAPLFAYTQGGLALGVGFASVGRHTLSRDLAELFLEGFEENRTDYSVGDTSGERASYWDFAIGYGRELPGGLSLGATAHYLRGRSIVRSRLFEPRILFGRNDIEVDYVGVLARGGSGFALDVGAAYRPHPRLTLSGAITNVVARMNWSEDLFVRSVTVDRELLEALSPTDLLDRYEASEREFDPHAASLQAFNAAEGLYQDAVPPAFSRLGVAWSPLTGTHLAADYHRRLTHGRLGDAWGDRFSLGIQQKLALVSLRAGYATAADGAEMITGGLSLGPLDLGVGRYRNPAPDDALARGWIATFGLGVRP